MVYFNEIVICILIVDMNVIIAYMIEKATEPYNTEHI